MFILEIVLIVQLDLLQMMYFKIKKDLSCHPNNRSLCVFKILDSKSVLKHIFRKKKKKSAEMLYIDIHTSLGHFVTGLC